MRCSAMTESKVPAPLVRLLGYPVQSDFVEALLDRLTLQMLIGAPRCIVRRGGRGRVLRCDRRKRGGVSRAARLFQHGQFIHRCTIPGFWGEFVPLMNQPPSALLSPRAAGTYGKSLRARRRSTRASLNKEPASRRKQALSPDM